MKKICLLICVSLLLFPLSGCWGVLTVSSWSDATSSELSRSSGIPRYADDLQFTPGAYIPIETIHLDGPSSLSKEAFLEQFDRDMFLIGGDYYVRMSRYAKKDVLVSSARQEPVSYEEIDLTDKIVTVGWDLTGLPDDNRFTIDISEFTQRVGYRIIQDDKDTGLRLYCLDDELWLGSVSRMGPDKNSWICTYILKLKTFMNKRGELQCGNWVYFTYPASASNALVTKWIGV